MVRKHKKLEYRPYYEMTRSDLIAELDVLRGNIQREAEGEALAAFAKLKEAQEEFKRNSAKAVEAYANRLNGDFRMFYYGRLEKFPSNMFGHMPWARKVIQRHFEALVPWDVAYHAAKLKEAMEKNGAAKTNGSE